jgi:hypothetical protein
MRWTIVLCSILLVIVVGACGGDDSSSPTEPEVEPLSVSGYWEGAWGGVVVAMELEQQAGSPVAQGLLIVGGSNTFSIAGTIATESSGNGTFEWEDREARCGFLGGALRISNSNRMAGPAVFSTVGCGSDPGEFVDTMRLEKRQGKSSLAPRDEISVGTFESLGQLLSDAD